MPEIKPFADNETTLNQVAVLYSEIWKAEDNEFLDRLKRHATYEGFRGLIAYDDNQDVVGYAYGYKSLKNQYYNGVLRKELTTKEEQFWLDDCFEMVELAVHPSARCKNLGRKMIERLLEGSENRTAILTTQVDNVPARALYEKLNWVVIKDSFLPDETKPYVMMGKVLKKVSMKSN